MFFWRLIYFKVEIEQMLHKKGIKSTKIELCKMEKNLSFKSGAFFSQNF